MPEQRQAIDGTGNVAIQNSGDGNSFTISVGSETRLTVTRSHNLRVRVTAPLHLLLPENQIVPLVGRDEQKQSLDAWLDNERPISVRVITGEGGSGKTRLALDLCRRAEERGWHAGFVSADELTRFHEAKNVEAWRTSEPTLLVVDYAATKAPILQRWLKALARIDALPDAGKLRLLLLERHGTRAGGWWQQLLLLGGLEGARLEILLDPPEPEALAPIITPRHRRVILRTVMEEASRLDGLDPPLEPPAGGEDPWFDGRLADETADNSPLLLHMAALAAVQVRKPHALAESRTGLALRLADSEIARLRKLAGAQSVQPRDLQHLVAALTLEGGADAEALHRLITEERDALGMAGSADDLRDAVRVALPPPARAVVNDPADPGQVQPTAPRVADAVRPDLVGEAFILRTLDRDDLPPTVQQGHLNRCWQRAPQAVAEGLVRLGQDFGAVASAHTTTPAPIRWLEHAVEVSTPDRLFQLASAIPVSTINLADVALLLGERLTAVSAHLEHTRNDAAAAIRAFWLHWLSVRYSNLGRLEDAVASGEEAVNRYRRLAQDQPETFLPSLAMALNTLSVHYIGFGRREKALAASEEAVAIHRRLAQDRSDSFLPDLAMALNNLSICHSKLGRHEKALAASQDAVAIRRRIAQDQPDASLPSLASALNNLSIGYSSLGRSEDALAVSEEAANLFRRLAEDRADAFLPNLATALTNLSIRYSKLGRHRDALTSSQEAANVYQRLAHDRPDAFLPNLAMALNNLSGHLSDLGRREDALAAGEDAASLFRRLAQDRPDAFLPDLASALNNLSTHFSNLGRREDALAASQDAANLYQRLAHDRPDAFLPNLAMALNNLSGHLSRLGRHEHALAASQDAANLYQRLAHDRPDAFLPDLAMALNNLSGHLSDLGRREDALAAGKDAASLFRRLAQDRPDAFLPGLASALNNLSTHLSNLGRREDALAASEEAVAIRRSLAQHRPDAFLPDLAQSFAVRGNALEALGKLEEAVASDHEAVTALAGPFLALPRAFAEDMVTYLREYLRRADAAAVALDEDLLAPILEALQPFMQQNGDGE